MATQSKYRNVRTEFQGIKFASKMEANRYAELLLLVRAGEIRDLELQPRFQLAPAVRFEGATRLTTALDYVADFRYWDVRKGRGVIEDAKGAKTKIYLLKKHLMKALLGLDIFESKPR
jgi:hypothetical protein